MTSLIERIQQRIIAGRPNDHPGEWLAVLPPVSFVDIESAETALGFRLPDLLRRLYTEIGNGGFGPVFGLLPLSAASIKDSEPPEFDLVSDYHRLVRCYEGQSEGDWPTALAPAFYLGCTVFEFIDCSDQTGRVVGFDPSTDELSVILRGSRLVAPSLEYRLEAWLAGDPVSW